MKKQKTNFASKSTDRFILKPSNWKNDPALYYYVLRRVCFFSSSKLFCFFRVGKTAGISWHRFYLQKQVFDLCNAHIKRVPNIYDPFWYNYYKFIIVRNPWDRMLSSYFYNPQGDTRPFKTFESFIHHAWDSNGNPVNPHWWAAHYFYEDLFTQRPLVNFVGKVENLQSDFDRICAIIKIEKGILPHKNVSIKKTKSTKEYYTQETWQIVAEQFKKDIKIFGYESMLDF